MLFATIKQILALTQKLVYLCMLGLGIYLIYQGEVLQKFQLMRTNFAVYKEHIFEFPTIGTCIYPYSYTFKLGRDFNIQFKAGVETFPLEGINLTIGENEIKNSRMKVSFQRYHLPNSYTITQIHFEASMPLDENKASMSDYRNHRFRRNL